MVLGFVAILIGYLLGSFPTAYIITKLLRGIDIRTVDVGNVGSAAAIRQVGLIPGLIVAFLDIAKGAGTILIGQNLLNITGWWLYAAGFAALLGHCYPIYIGFRGGQGTATVIGVFSILAPHIMLVLLPLLGLTLLLVRRIFPMLCIIAPLFPITIWFTYNKFDLLAYSLLIVAFMSYRNWRGIYREILGIIRRIKAHRKIK